MTLPTFLDRFEYLRLNGKVGEETFGYYRYLNQVFYRSAEWKKIRNLVIVRDNGCDLGLSGYDIHGKVYIHHMNPITVDDIRNRSEFLLNPDYLICVSNMTHEAITYGDKNLLLLEPIERTKNDTCPWRR
nr:MAG TPA: HNH endonuclease bacteriophage, HNH Endonuclease, DNA.52A [Caudoviricetes sp.]